jgi:hypothetical protein
MCANFDAEPGRLFLFQCLKVKFILLCQCLVRAMVGLSDVREMELHIVRSLWSESMSKMLLGISGVLSHLVHMSDRSGGLHC